MQADILGTIWSGTCKVNMEASYRAGQDSGCAAAVEVLKSASALPARNHFQTLNFSSSFYTKL